MVIASRAPSSQVELLNVAPLYVHLSGHSYLVLQVVVYDLLLVLENNLIFSREVEVPRVAAISASSVRSNLLA